MSDPLAFTRTLRRFFAPALAAAMEMTGASGSCGAGETITVIPPPAVDRPGPKTAGALETTVLAGGCFWGVQAVFQHVKGVVDAVSGYAGGDPALANYDAVSSGASGHAEAVQVTFDPALISFGQLLHIFFSVAHDPTQLNRQGPDRGTQYRSAIFTSSDEQRHVARDYVAQLDAARVFATPIATSIEPLDTFFPAETYHQDYATLHPDNPYIAYNDLPKVAGLRQMFPDFYRAQPALVLKRP